MIDPKTQKMIREGAKLVISDDEFNKLLHNQLENNKKFLEEKPRTSFIPEIFVFTRHNFKDDITGTMIILGDLPEKGAVVSRYDMMKAIGFKYAEELVNKKKPGKKNMPIAVFMNTEAWVKHMDKKEADELEKEQRSIEHDKGTKEILITFGMTMDGRVNMGAMDIKRDKDKNIFLVNPNFTDFDEKDEHQPQSFLLECFYRGFARGLKEWEVKN